MAYAARNRVLSAEGRRQADGFCAFVNENAAANAVGCRNAADKRNVLISGIAYRYSAISNLEGCNVVLSRDVAD